MADCCANPPYGRDIRYGVAVLETLDISPLIVGAARPKLIADRPGGMRFPVSPAAEQKAIAAQFSTKAAEPDAPIDRVVAAIACLTGYRQVLRAAAVAGTIGVRGAA